MGTEAALLLGLLVALGGCAGAGGSGGSGERVRDGFRDRSVGRTTPRADAATPVPGTLAPAPRLPVEQRIARRLNGPPEAVTASTTTMAGTPVTAVGRADDRDRNRPEDVYEIDLELPRYRPGAHLNGEIRTVGSSTLTTLFGSWSDDFERTQGRIQLRITGGGSSAAVRPLIAGDSDIAPMAREMTAREIETFRARWGYGPTRLTVALDAIAVFVHKDNPLRSLNLAQLESIFALEPRGGLRTAQTWRDLGVTGPLASRPINRYGPRRTQGIHSVFRSLVLGGGEYTLSMQSEPVSSAVVQAAGADETGIAFSSRLFATARTRAVALAAAPADRAQLPTARNITEGRYPLVRRLYVYVNKPPDQPLPVHVAEFLRYVCSYEGQERLARDGGIALSREIGDAECSGRI
jgi:phosphate transport system substrate-binding protein